MSWEAAKFDWNQLRAFLATAEEGSLTAAAKVLGTTQPTISRQVTALEEALGVTLLERGPRSLLLTEAGRALLQHARKIRDEANQISLTASSHTQNMEGPVTITASDGMCAMWLPQMIGEIRTNAPGIELNIVSNNRMADLQSREADIAIRHVRPHQPELIGRLARETIVHLYGTEDYIKTLNNDIANATLLGFDEIEPLIGLLKSQGVSVDRDQFRVNSNNGLALWAYLKEGLGLGFMLREMGEGTSNIIAFRADEIAVPLQFWLVSHRELLTNPRIRYVYDVLSKNLSQKVPLRFS